MLKLSLISTELQLIIAQKMDYFVQREFDMSSKHGKAIIDSIKSKMMFPVDSLTMSHCGIFFQILTPWDKRPVINWSTLRDGSNLPRFKVLSIEAYEGTLMSFLNVMIEKINFVQHPVRLIYPGIHPTVEVSEKLSEIFQIASFQSRNYAPHPELLTIAKFCEINSINMPICNIPNYLLLLLKSEELVFKQYSNPPFSTIDTTAILFFQEWFLKNRKIEWFEITDGQKDASLKMDSIVSSEFPTTLIWQCEDVHTYHTVMLLKADTLRQLNRNDKIFSVDRGDKKLMIIVLVDDRKIIGQEYAKLEDVIEIDSPHTLPKRWSFSKRYLR